MAETLKTSIDASSVFPSSSASSISPGPSDETAPRLKSPWSQIVRGSSTSPRSKPGDPSPCDPHRDEQTVTFHQQNLSSELMVSDRTTPGNTAPISSSSIDRRQGAHESHCETLTSSPDGSMNQSSLSDGKLSQQSPSKSPKVAWGKLISNPVQVSEQEPVMGAVTWPALSEARNPKAFEPVKTGTAQKSSPKAASSFNERHHFQAPPLLQQETRAVDHQEPTNQITVNGHHLPNLPVQETPSPHKTMQGADSNQSKWSGGKDSKVVAATEASLTHGRGAVTSHVNNKESSRNFMWEQSRGNHSFPAYGRGHATFREHHVPGHQQQRGGQRNMPQPLVPFANPNPGYVYPSGYQAVGAVDVPNSMYYMPAPTTDPVLGATYFVQPGVFMPAPDILTIQGMVVKQIEYYFSVENLCRDIYLRSKMDEWGFVPVSVIANFNRVRMITQNPYVIIEALRSSNAVELQGDKVRKKGDWANWLLPSSQPLATTSAAKVIASSKKEDVDGGTANNSSLTGTDNHSDGHSDLVFQIGEQVEALSVTATNSQTNKQDSLLHEEAAGSLSNRGSEDFQLDDVNDKQSTQPCHAESGPGMK